MTARICDMCGKDFDTSEYGTNHCTNHTYKSLLRKLNTNIYNNSLYD